MNVEQTLTVELRVVAEAVDSPPAPAVAALLQEAERTRTRSRVRWAATTFLAAAAVIAAIVAGSQIGRPSASPGPTTPTRTADTFPTGAPPRTYVDEHGVLHLDGVAEPGNGWKAATTLGDLTHADLGAPDSGLVAVFLGTTRVGTLHRVLDDEIQVSPDRRVIAWVEVDGTTGSIVVAAVSDHGVQVLGRLSVDTLLVSSDNETRERLIGVADDHTVTYGGVVGGHSWSPGGRPRTADISAYLYGPQGFPSKGQDVQVNPAGTWGAWLADPGPKLGAEREVEYTAVAFQQPHRPDTRTKIAMPTQDADVRGIYWESDADVILSVFDDSGRLVRHVRCNVVRRSCEYAPEQPTG